MTSGVPNDCEIYVLFSNEDEDEDEDGNDEVGWP
jgi:hypothetical protein